MSTATAEGRAARRRHERQRAITYQRPWVYEKQEEFLFTKARYSLVEATTKSGKTQGCLIWLLEKALLEGFDGWNGWWVAPVHGQAQIAYRRMKRLLRPLGKLVRFNDSEKTVTLPNGAALWFKSGEKPDNLYGEDVYAAVIDEASRIRELSWYAVRSTLTATRGPIRIIGNVKGRKNWFYALARRAQTEMHTPEGASRYFYTKLTAWDAVEAGILDREEVEDARRVLPEQVFNELYLAEPTEDGANPFNVKAIRDGMMERLAPGPVATFGVDLAKSVDFTVSLGLNRDGRMAHLDRWQSTWEATETRIKGHVGTARALVDSTGVGDPIVERLQKGRPNYEGFKFTASSKQQLMEGLALAISTHAANGDRWLWAGPGDVLLNELEVFEFVYTRTGVRYSAPAGFHDDTVMALALAVEHHRQTAKLPTRGGATATF